MKENLKLGLLFYLVANVLMLAKGCDESTWMMSQPCKEKVTLIARLFPGYVVGCKLGENSD